MVGQSQLKSGEHGPRTGRLYKVSILPDPSVAVELQKKGERQMSRILCVMILALSVASCGGGYSTPPRNLDDACSIATERPQYVKAFRATERRWGVPVAVQMATIYHESRFRGDARTPYRYALGIIPPFGEA